MSAHAAIECIRLTKVYPGGLFARAVTALDQLDLRVEEGEIFGYLGPNGAGKTTTIRLLLDLIRPTTGHCRVLGLDAQREAVAVKQYIGNLPSELRLWEHMTAEHAIRYLARLRPGADIRYALSLAERLRLQLDQPIGRFSTGNKRKVGIVQALMHRPRLAILDEPTSGLDPLMRRIFADLLTEIRNEGRTVFLSSHVLAEVQSVCDRVAILRAGRLQALEPLHRLTRFRWVFVATSAAVDTRALAALEGVETVQAVPNGYRIQVSGSFDALIKFLAQYPIDDLRTDEANLEDIFVNLYDETRT